MKIVLIWAQTPLGVIGRSNAIPWNCPPDIKRFQRLTTGNIALMGRKTWESLPFKYRPLPNRDNYVVSTDSDLLLPGANVHLDLEGLLLKLVRRAVPENKTIYVIGGSQVYQQTLPYATHLEVTQVPYMVDGDAHAPNFSPKDWQLVNRETEHVVEGEVVFSTYARR